MTDINDTEFPERGKTFGFCTVYLNPHTHEPNFMVNTMGFALDLIGIIILQKNIHECVEFLQSIAKETP